MTETWRAGWRRWGQGSTEKVLKFHTDPQVILGLDWIMTKGIMILKHPFIQAWAFTEQLLCKVLELQRCLECASASKELTV